MKRLIVCCDGTWNTPDAAEDDIPCPTNVVKVAESVLPRDEEGVAQVVYYDTGVGTSGGRVMRGFAGATGRGLSDNVRKAYRWLVEKYEPGDEIYLLGFSRGAFTARSLGGLIRNSGILRWRAIDQEKAAYDLYRSRSPASHPRARESRLFRRTFAVEERTPIRCVAVWDTVGALGNPLLIERVVDRRNAFHDTGLSSSVQHAFHAVAIDEKRRLFEPALWYLPADAEGQVLEQRWFVGVHANVGGGYPRVGLSDLALDWIVRKTEALGVRYGELERKMDWREAVEVSWRGMYRALPPHHRPIRRPDLLPGRAEDSGPIVTNETIDPSVLERWEQDSDYRPPNLEDFFRRFPAEAP
jgi:uncharacterized protein (DUF2235 family)